MTRREVPLDDHRDEETSIHEKDDAKESTVEREYLVTKVPCIVALFLVRDDIVFLYRLDTKFRNFCPKLLTFLGRFRPLGG